MVMDSVRRGWNLREHSDNRVAIQCIRLVTGLSAKDVSVKDVTLCLIPSLGILGKYHPDNRNRILQSQRTMLRLDRQIRMWNEGDTSDPNEGEISEIFHRRDRMLTHPNVKAAPEQKGRCVAEAPGS